MHFGPPTPVESGLMLRGCGPSGAGITYTPPLDAVSSKLLAAYGCHRLITAVSDGVRVRESAGSTESDIGTLEAGDFDGASFTTFINGGTGEAAKWYDQVAANDLIQATAADQPSISLTAVGGKAGLVVASNDVMRAVAFANTIGTGDFEFWCVFNPSDLTADRCLSSLHNYTPSFYCSISGAAKAALWNGAAYVAFDTAFSTGTDYLVRFFRVSGVISCAINGTTEATTRAYATDISGTKTLNICSESAAGASTPYVGKMAACIWFKEGLTAGEASTLTAALKTYFGIA